MLLNIALLLLVFGASRKRISPYGAAALFGIIKAAIYAVFSQNYVLSATMGTIYFLLAAGFVYFLSRIDRQESKEAPEVPSYSTSSANAIKLRWEYAPLAILLLLIIGGELLLL